MTDMTPEQIVEVVAPIVERAVDQLRAEMQATVEVLAGNDDALVAEIQRLRGSGGEQVAETLTRAGEAWERFVRAEAEKLGLKIIVPKKESIVQKMHEASHEERGITT